MGNTGLRVSALGFGCGAVGGLMVGGAPDEQRQAVARALDAGITYFDTAPGYGNGQSEEHLGRVMQALGAWDRVVVGTKVRLSPTDLDQPRQAIRASLETSLRRLARANVDVFHLHNPIALIGGASDRRGALDLDTVLGEITRGMHAVVEAGLAAHVGITGLGDTAALTEAVLAERFETVQTYFNVLNPSAGYTGHAPDGQQDFHGLIDAAARVGTGVIVIRVLAAGAAAAVPQRAAIAGDPGGALAGSAYPDDLERAQRLAPLAAELGLTGPVELAVRFGLSKPGVSTVLVGYSSLAHLEQAIQYAERGALPDAAVQRILAAMG